MFAVIDNGAVWEDLAVSGVHYTICIPISPDTASGSDIRIFPETRVFSRIIFGDYSVVPMNIEAFRKEMSERKITPSGPPRVVMHVGAYTGAHYKPEDYCYECVVPIRSGLFPAPPETFSISAESSYSHKDKKPY